MVEVKPIHVSCSSQDPAFPAVNLVQGAMKPSDEREQWLCSSPDEKFAHVILTYEKPFIISSLEIKNKGSAYVQVEGSNSEEPSRYKVLWKTQSLMTPTESRQGKDADGIYIFLPQDLPTDEKDKTWDTLKITCSQPFNKLHKFGLSHIIARSALPVKEEIPSSPALCGVDIPTVKREPVDEEVINIIQVCNQHEKEMSDHQKQMSSEVSSSSVCSETPFAAPVKQEPSCGGEGFFSASVRSEPSSSILDTRQSLCHQATRVKQESSPQVGGQPIVGSGESTPMKRRISDSGTSSDTNSDDVQVVKRPALTNITYKPFNKLLEGVKIVISGFENPVRSDLRARALEMGATYSPYWTEHCTHLICAFLNTPKYRQANADHGLIVTRSWIDECYTQRKRLPWRRFALNSFDLRHDMEGIEIWELLPNAASASSSNDSDYSRSTLSNSGRLIENSPVRVICNNLTGNLSIPSTHHSPSVKREMPDNGESTSEQQSGLNDIATPEVAGSNITPCNSCNPSPFTLKREVNNEEANEVWHSANCSTEHPQTRRSQGCNTSPKYHMLSATSSGSGEHESSRSSASNGPLLEPGSDGYAGYYRPISQPCAVPHSSPSATYLVPPVIMLPQTLPQYFVPVSQQFQPSPPSRDTYMNRTVSSPQAHGQHIRVIQHSNKAANQEENSKQT